MTDWIKIVKPSFLRARYARLLTSQKLKKVKVNNGEQYPFLDIIIGFQ